MFSSFDLRLLISRNFLTYILYASANDKSAGIFSKFGWLALGKIRCTWKSIPCVHTIVCAVPMSVQFFSCATKTSDNMILWGEQNHVKLRCLEIKSAILYMGMWSGIGYQKWHDAYRLVKFERWHWQFDNCEGYLSTTWCTSIVCLKTWPTLLGKVSSCQKQGMAFPTRWYLFCGTFPWIAQRMASRICVVVDSSINGIKVSRSYDCGTVIACVTH